MRQVSCPCGEIVRVTRPGSITRRWLTLSVRKPNGPLTLIGEEIVEISGWIKT
jgi:hypothetical protein